MQPADIARIFDVGTPLKRKSMFLFGPRQVGKSWLIRHVLEDVKVYNLLDNAVLLKLSLNPGLLSEQCTEKGQVVVIDEIQKLPELLDQVQLLIEERRQKFLLTGSSARKLKKSGVNLLGGRASTKYLHPFSWVELDSHFDLERALQYGLLPPIYFSESPYEDLCDYAGTYLKEEVIAEGASRNLPAFSRFLEVAALSSGELVNFANIAGDSQVAVSTVREYYQVLEDTLIGRQLPSWTGSKKRKAISRAKFYFFDIGVSRALQGKRSLEKNSSDFGVALEHYILHEIWCYLDYRMPVDYRLSYWRSTSGMEVDFIIGDEVAVEVKASSNIQERMLKGLRALAEEKSHKRYITVCLEDARRTVGGVEIMPIREFLEELWNGKIVR